MDPVAFNPHVWARNKANSMGMQKIEKDKQVKNNVYTNLFPPSTPKICFLKALTKNPEN